MKWEKVSISSCLLKIHNVNPVLDYKDSVFHYIDISSVSSIEKRILSAQIINGIDSPSRARQLIEYGDILVSTVRPNLNAVALVNEEYEGSVASTGFCVLRCDKKKLLPKYLYYWVRSQSFINDMVKKATGASYPAVSDTIVKQSTFPLPPLHIQQQIADTLDKADALRRKDKEMLKKYDELAEAIFYEMFGDPKLYETKWRIISLEDVCVEIVDCPHSTPKHTVDITEYCCIRTSELINGRINWESMKYVDHKEYIGRTKRLIPKEGDIVYGREGSFGDAVLLPNQPKFCLGQRTMIFRPDNEKIDRIFLWWQLRSNFVYEQALKKNCGSTVGHVNVKDIKKFKIFVPPLKSQNEFSRIFMILDSAQLITLNNHQKSSSLFSSLINSLI